MSPPPLPGISSTLLAAQGIHAPTLQSCLNYVLLGVVWGPLRWQLRRPLAYPLWLYALVALLDLVRGGSGPSWGVQVQGSSSSSSSSSSGIRECGVV
jgi:hypothetical protein